MWQLNLPIIATWSQRYPITPLHLIQELNLSRSIDFSNNYVTQRSGSLFRSQSPPPSNRKPPTTDSNNVMIVNIKLSETFYIILFPFHYMETASVSFIK